MDENKKQDIILSVKNLSVSFKSLINIVKSSKLYSCISTI